MDLLSFAAGVGLASVIPVVVLAMQASSMPMYRGPWWWTAGFGLIAASRLVTIARSQDALHGPASLLTLLLLAGGSALLVEGIGRFQGRGIPPRLPLSLLVVVVLAGTWVTLVDPALVGYQVIASLIWAIAGLAAAWILHGPANRSYAPAARLLELSFAGLATFHLIRLPFVISGALPPDSSFELSGWTLATQAVTLIGLLLVSFGLVLMAGQRSSSDLQASSARLAEMNATLEERVANRTLELQEANRSLSEFTGSVSHDLKAPLRAINGFAAILLRDERDHLTERGQGHLEAIVTSTARMARLIEQLLDYARLGSRPLHTVPVPIGSVVDRILTAQSGRVTASGAVVSVPTPLATPLGDPELVERIVGVLVENALVFTAPGVAPRVTIAATEHDGRVAVSVADEGIGMRPEHLERIFEVFTTLNQPEVYPGTGMGLAMARKAAELMGTRIEVSSSPGSGARFWIELPAAG